MLNGIDPILIFQLYKKITSNVTTVKNGIPVSTSETKRATVAVIPIYLSEELTGIYIDTESKNIDIDTSTDSLLSGEAALVSQKKIASIATITLQANSNSVGLTILSAIAEQLADKVTSQEYELTYMHRGITIFGGLLHGISIDQGSNDDLYKVKLELSRGNPPSKSVEVNRDESAVRLSSQGETPPVGAPTAVKSTATTSRSTIMPRLR